MELIEQSSILWGECPTDLIKGIEWIEKSGRVCYRSEDKIIEGSGMKFVNGIIKRKHYSVIEHSNLVLRTVEKSTNPNLALITQRGIFDSPYFNFCISGDQVYISGNWRAWIEFNNRVNPANSIGTVEDFVAILLHALPNGYEFVSGDDVPVDAKAVTCEFVTDRAVTHELVRHRPASYSQESQRYVRYDGGMLFIKPAWYNDADENCIQAWTQAVEYSERMYMYLREHGMKAEDARTVLPNSTATKIVMTAYIPEWRHVFNLRTSKAAYPMIRNMMAPMLREFVNNDWV